MNENTTDSCSSLPKSKRLQIQRRACPGDKSLSQTLTSAPDSASVKNAKRFTQYLSSRRFVYPGDQETLSPCQIVDEVIPAQLTIFISSRPLIRIKEPAPCFQTFIFRIFRLSLHIFGTRLTASPVGMHSFIILLASMVWSTKMAQVDGRLKLNSKVSMYQCYTLCWA